MKIVYISTLVSKRKMDYIIDNSKKKPLQSIQRYHRLLCEGLINENCEVSTISAIPMSKEISDKKIWNEKTEVENGIKYQYLPFINIKILRQICLLIFTIFFVLKEILFSKEKPIFICDILNSTISATSLFLAKLFGIRCIAIVTDLPKDMQSSNKLSIWLNKKLQSEYSDYILLTEAMNEEININNRPYVIIEGICEELKLIKEKKSEKYIMYAGGLKEEYGLKYLIEGFLKANIKDVKLHIYGSGELEEYIKSLKDERIYFGGVLKNEDIIEREQNATILVNPRYSNDEYTKYSFPSKNMEYMSTGVPVLTSKLQGIPKEYNKYTYIIDEENATGIKNKLIEIFNKSENELKLFGKKAKDFVLKNKNNREQAKKLKQMINNNSTSIKKVENNKLTQIYGFIVLFLTIILSRNTLITSEIIGFYYATIIMFIFYIPLLYRFFYKIFSNRIHLIVFVLLLLMGISILWKLDFQLYNFSIIMYIVLAYVYINCYKLKDILKWFVYIMFFLSLYSLICVYFMYPLISKIVGFNNLDKLLLFFYNNSSVPFLNLFFSFPVVVNGYIRNFGIFTEPGFYQFYILVALIIVLFKDFFSKKNKMVLVTIFVITMLTTFSTAGIICLAILGAYLLINYYLRIRKKLTKKHKIYFFTTIIISFFLFILFINFDNQISSMFNMIITKLTSSNSSTNARLGSMFYTLELFFKSIIKGNKLSIVLDNSVIITNTNITFFAIYGILSGIILVILHFRFSEKLINNRKNLLIIFLITFLSVNNHLFLGIQSYWLLMLLGIKNNKDEL